VGESAGEVYDGQVGEIVGGRVGIGAVIFPSARDIEIPPKSKRMEVNTITIPRRICRRFCMLVIF
jgi:hypothetical protein